MKMKDFRLDHWWSFKKNKSIFNHFTFSSHFKNRMGKYLQIFLIIRSYLLMRRQTSVESKLYWWEENCDQWEIRSNVPSVSWKLCKLKKPPKISSQDVYLFYAINSNHDSKKWVLPITLDKHTNLVFFFY